MGVEVPAVVLESPAEVKLNHALQFEPLEELRRVEPVVSAVHVQVVQVEEQVAAAQLAQLVQEVGLLQLRLRKVEVVNVVLEQKERRHASPHLCDASRQQLERLPVIRERHRYPDVQLAPVDVLGDVVRQVLAVPRELQPVVPPRELVELIEVEAVRSTNRETDPVRDHRPLPANALEERDRGRILDVPRLGARAEVGPDDVGNDLDEVERRWRVEYERPQGVL